MGRSDTIAKLLPALIRARGEMTKVIKDATNPHFKSKYADLAGCLEACEPALGKYGLAVLQTTRWSDGVLTLDTVLAHDSGEWISSEYPVLCTYTRPQEIGAGLTYARRYSYLAITGRAPEDDDGETASGRGNGHTNGYTNGHTNGHTNGARKPSASVPAPIPAPKPAPAPAATDLLAVGTFAVVSGGGLRRWAREVERKHGPGIAAHIAKYAASHGWPENSTRWSQEQIEAAYHDAEDNLELVYDQYRNEPPAADRDYPADCGSRFD